MSCVEELQNFDAVPDPDPERQNDVAPAPFSWRTVQKFRNLCILQRFRSQQRVRATADWIAQLTNVELIRESYKSLKKQLNKIEGFS
jgi:hypothetical protein